MKYLLLMGFLCVGCTTVQRSVLPVATTGVRSRIESAVGSADKAVESGRRASKSLSSAESRVADLLKVANAAERPLVNSVQSSLGQTHTELDMTLRELATARDSLGDAESKLTTLQGELDKQASDLDRAEKQAAEQRAKAAFWWGVSLKLGLLSLGLGIWTFRRPIGAIFGVPFL